MTNEQIIAFDREGKSQRLNDFLETSLTSYFVGGVSDGSGFLESEKVSKKKIYQPENDFRLIDDDLHFQDGH